MRKSSFPLTIGLTTLAFAGCHDTDNDKLKDFRHVVVIISDDHAFHTLGCYGNEVIRTPNLDKLAEQGITFTNAYCNAPICSASRQSMLTGQYPQSTGVTLLFTPFSEKNNPTIANHLGHHGFRSQLIGKTHFNHWIWANLWDQWPTYGFDSIMEGSTYQQWKNSINPRPLPDEMPFYQRANPTEDPAGFWNAANLPQPVYDEEARGTFFAREAITFMDQNKDGRFLLWLAFNEPHAPFDYPIEFAGEYDPAMVPLPNGSPEDDRWVPAIFRDLSETERRGIIAAYYTSVTYLDKNVGMVVDALEELGIRDNTLIVYISDNGYLLNDHKRFEKHTMWAESVKVPLIMVGDGIPAGTTTDAIFEGVDLVPTIIDMLGLPALKEAQGVSFRELLTGQKADVKPYAYSVFLEDNMAMIASKEWKYVFMTGKRDLGLEYATGSGAPGISHFLYDLINDPGETSNLANNTAHTTMVDSLQNELLAWFQTTHPYADELPENFTKEGKLAWFCEPRDVGAEHGGKPLRVITE